MNRRRVLTTGVLLLLGGAIVNVAVAWGCAAWVDVGAGRIQDYTGQPVAQRYCWMLRFDAFGSTFISADCVALDDAPRSFIVSYEIVPDFTTLLPSWVDDTQWPAWSSIHGAGWPARSLYRIGSRFAIAPEKAIGNLLPLPSSRLGDYYLQLPIHPIWPGFAINTIFYAAMLWVVFFSPGIIKRTIRRRRGLCPACAYPIGTSPVCTECGKSLV